jgi:hypothetical protein
VTRTTTATDRLRHPILFATAALLAAVTLVWIAPAKANNVTLRARIDAWSKTIGADAHVVALAAANRHPRRMTTYAVRFRRDALLARSAISLQHASTANGARARLLALAAFSSYAKAGTLWATTGRDRVAGRTVAATKAARAAAAAAKTGNALLLRATKLL